jgi:hypothetical protein
MKRRSNAFNDLIRVGCFVVAVFWSVYVIRAIRDGKLEVGLHGGKYIVISQTSDTAVFWGILIFITLMVVAVFYAVFFGKDEPNA